MQKSSRWKQERAIRKQHKREQKRRSQSRNVPVQRPLNQTSVKKADSSVAMSPGLWVPPSAHDPLANIGPFLCWSDLQPGRCKVPPNDLVERFSELDWAGTLEQTARIAALSSAQDEPSARALHEVTRGALENARIRATLLPNGYTGVRNVILGVPRVAPSRPIFTEALAHLMAAMAILYGAESGPTPNDLQLTLLMLALNDYMLTWKNEATPETSDSLTDNQALLANMVLCTQYGDRTRQNALALG